MPIELNLADQFWFSVNIAGGRKVYGVQCEITYPPDILQAVLANDQAVKTRLGGFLGQEDQVTLIARLENDQQGKIVIGYSRKGNAAAMEGDGHLFDVLFNCTGAGEAELKFQESYIYDDDLKPQQSQWLPVQVRVSAINVVSAQVVPVNAGSRQMRPARIQRRQLEMQKELAKQS